MLMKSISNTAAATLNKASLIREEAANAENTSIAYAATGSTAWNNQSSNSGLYAPCVRMRRATSTQYATPPRPTRPQTIAKALVACQGTRRTADKKSTTLKWTIVGVANAGPAWSACAGGLAATSVITTNCNPISAP